jgi:uncharacterized membrane protein
MMMPPPLRKCALAAHVTASVGWLGAVAAFLALALAGLYSADPQTVRGSYLAMQVTTLFVVLPLCLAALITGLIQALGTSWGLVRHYWVLAKLMITVLSTALLLLHMRPIAHLAAIAGERPLLDADLRGVRVQLAADAAFAIAALVVATALSVYKPQGMTPYGRRVEGRIGPSVAAGSVSRMSWGYYVVMAILALVLAALVVHLASGGLHSH